MAHPSVPKDGLVLLRTSDRTLAHVPLQVMRLSLAQKTTDDILKSLQNKEKVTIHFGKQVTVQNGTKTHRLSSVPETVPSEIYRRSDDKPHTFYFSGKLSHRLEAQKAEQDTAKADEALAALTQSLKSHQEQKASNEAKIITDKDELRKLNEAAQNPKAHPAVSRKDRLLGRAAPSPLGAGSSPALGPTSARSVPSTVSKDQVRLNAIKFSMLHLLAVKPLDCQTLTRMLRAPMEDCKKVLQKLSRDGSEGTGLHELKDTAYRELDLGKFVYPSGDDWKRAQNRAISAFDRKRITPTDPVWENLLLVEERGKGKGPLLSRLRLGQPNPLAVKRVEEKVASESDDAHPRPAKKAKVTKSVQRVGKPESVPAETSKAVKISNGKGALLKDKKKATTSKFKSAEMIEDSDEELEGVKVTDQPTKRDKSATSKKTSSTDSKTATSSKVNKSSTTAGADSGSLKPNTSSRNAGKTSPLRNGKSPTKPSPLGSSPPTNATDLDDSQRSRASSSQTLSSRAADSQAKSGTLKRKGEDLPSAATKRQHGSVNGINVARAVTNGAGKHLSQINGSSSDSSLAGQRSRAPSSASDSASTATTGTSKSGNNQRVDVHDQRRRFQEAYKSYQNFHSKVIAIPEAERDQADIKKLTRMHDRINQLKTEIWKAHRARQGGRVNGTTNEARALKRARA